jgi:hypothetical protein
MWIWLLTLLKGFLPIDGKRVGKIIWVLILSAVSFVIMTAIYNRILQPTQKIEKVETQIINNCPEENKIIGLRFNLWKLKLSFGV